MRCINCGTENYERNLNCSNCGAELTAEECTKGLTDLLKNKKFLGIAAGILSLVIIVLLIVVDSVIIPNQAVKNMRNAFASKSGEKVLSVFIDYCGDYSVIYDDLSKSGRKVFVEFEDCVSDLKDDLNNQPVETDINNYLLETTGDIVLPKEYSAITAIGQYNDELNYAVLSYYELYISKISYVQGVENYEAADYESAVYEFKEVINTDSWHESAQSKMQECYDKILENRMSAIESSITAGNYDMALTYISDLRNQDLPTEISNKLDEYEVKICNAKLAKIDEFIDNGDFEGANEYIESLGNGLSVDAKARLEQAVKNKANEYIKKADEALKSGERQGAYDMAKMAQNICPNDENINKRVAYFEQYLPFALYYSNNTISTSDDDLYGYTGGVEWDEKLKSNNNKTMEHCIRFYYQSEYKGDFDITYNLGKKYDNISGIAFLVDKYKNHIQNGYFEIYGDGKLLFTSKKITKNVMPSDFSVKTTGVEVLTLKFFGTRTEDWVLGDAWSGYAISNFVATKNLP